MDTSKKFLPYLCIATLMLTLSCNKSDPTDDCGCEGSTIEIITDEPASYRGGGRFIVPNQNAENLMRAVTCNMDSAWQVSTAGDTANYVISGRYKRRCTQPEDIYSSVPPSWPIEITAIRPK
jgi:hypothetical protein